MTDAKLPQWLLDSIGPRQVGGRYANGYWNNEYDVLDIKITKRSDGDHDWSIVVRGCDDGRIREHCTAWDARRDSVVSQPEAAALPAPSGASR